MPETIDGGAANTFAYDGAADSPGPPWEAPATPTTSPPRGHLILYDEDGTVYAFEVDGTPVSATSGVDDRKATHLLDGCARRPGAVRSSRS